MMSLALFGVLMGVRAAGNEAALHFVQEGDTLPALAERFLGSPEFADELGAYNQLTADQVLTPGTPIVLPGPERAEALQHIINAEVAMKDAAGREAGTYALEEFKRAVSLLESASEARRSATYPRSSLLARLALESFNKSAQLADRDAWIVRPVNVKAMFGGVQVSGDEGGSWSDLKNKSAQVSPGGMIKVQEGGRARIETGVGAVDLAAGSTAVVVASVEDRRSQQWNVVLQLLGGEISGAVSALTNEKSSFLIVNGGVEVHPAGSRFISGRSAEGRFTLAVLEGTVKLGRGGQAYSLTQGTGAYADPGGELKGPVTIPAAAEWTSPGSLEHSTARQVVDLAWNGTAGARYLVEIARDANFTKGFSLQASATPAIQTPFLEKGDYYARIHSVITGGIQGYVSETLLISVKPDLAIAWVEPSEKISRGTREVLGLNQMVVARPVSGDSSVVAIEYSVNGDNFAESAQGVRLEKSGEFVLVARGRGADGTFGEESQRLLVVDGEAPELRVHIGEVVDFPGSGLVRSISVLVDDNTRMGKVEYSLNDSAFEVYTAPLKLDVKTNHRFKVRASDVFGNSASTAVVIEKTGVAPEQTPTPVAEEDRRGTRSSGWRLF